MPEMARKDTSMGGQRKTAKKYRLNPRWCSCHWQDWPTCKVSPSQEKKKKKGAAQMMQTRTTR